MRNFALLFLIFTTMSCDQPIEHFKVSKNAIAYFGLFNKIERVLYIEVDMKFDQYNKMSGNTRNDIFIYDKNKFKHIGYMDNVSPKDVSDREFLKNNDGIYTVRYIVHRDRDYNFVIKKLQEKKSSCFISEHDNYIGFPRRLIRSNCFLVALR